MFDRLPLSHMRNNVYHNNNKNTQSEKRFPDSSITVSGKAANAGGNSAVEIKSTRKRFFAERSGIVWITAERQNAGTIWQA